MSRERTTETTTPVDTGDTTTRAAATSGNRSTDTAAVITAARKRGDTGLVTLLRLGVVLGVAGLWEAVSRFEILNSTDFPPFTVVAGAFATSLADAATWLAMWETVVGWALGLSLSILVGVIAGLLIGPSRFLTRSTSFLIDVLRATPAPAIIFILILVLGTTMAMKVALIFFAAVFPILIQTLYGVRGVDPVLRDLQRSYRISPWVAFFTIRLPAASPLIATGVRISASLALIVAVVAEYLGGVPGVGSLVDDVRLIGDFPRMYALILLVGFLSVALNLGVGAIEHRLLRWHASHREKS